MGLLENDRILVIDDTKVDVLDVVSIAEKAGAAILDVYNSTQGSCASTLKSDGSPVTEADVRANSIICAGLIKIAPSVPIVSEESDAIDYDKRKHFRYFWCVDPLDGTREFLKRNGHFTVNIALCDTHHPVLGVVTVPCKTSAYYALKGLGAYRRNTPNEGFARIAAASFTMDQMGLTIIASRSHADNRTKAYIQRFNKPKHFSIGSSLKLLRIAEGEAHIYPRLAPTCEWDTCAAHVILSEAGGKILQIKDGEILEKGDEEILDKGEELVYNKPDVLNPFFLAVGNLHKQSAK